MGIQFFNNATSALTADINNVVTSIDVVSTAATPLTAGNYCMLTIEQSGQREIVKCTGVSGNTYTVVRAQEGTTALSFTAGATVSNRVTAGTLGTIIGTWQIKTTNYTATSLDQILADTTAGAWTLTLPSSPVVNDAVEIADYAGTFSTNNLTVARNGSKIMGLTEDMTVPTNNVSFALVYTGATQGWRIV